jgi:hypothetical protein
MWTRKLFQPNVLRWQWEVMRSPNTTTVYPTHPLVVLSQRNTFFAVLPSFLLSYYFFPLHSLSFSWYGDSTCIGSPLDGAFFGDNKCIPTGKKHSVKYVCDIALHKVMYTSYKSGDCTGAIKENKDLQFGAQPTCVKDAGTDRYSMVWCN